MIKIVSSVIIGLIVYFVLVGMAGNNALGKLIGIIGAVASFCGYIILVQWADYNASLIPGIILIFGPIAVLVIILLIDFLFKDEGEK